MIQVFPETLVPMPEGSVAVPSRGIVDTHDEDFAAYVVGMHHARYYNPGEPIANIIKPTLNMTTAKPGDVISCHPGTWMGDYEPLQIFYRWTADGVDLDQAVTAQHTVRLEDVGKTLDCNVRAVDANNDELIVGCAAPCVVSDPITRSERDGTKKGERQEGNIAKHSDGDSVRKTQGSSRSYSV